MTNFHVPGFPVSVGTLSHGLHSGVESPNEQNDDQYQYTHTMMMGVITRTGSILIDGASLSYLRGYNTTCGGSLGQDL